MRGQERPVRRVPVRRDELQRRVRGEEVRQARDPGLEAEAGVLGFERGHEAGDGVEGGGEGVRGGGGRGRGSGSWVGGEGGADGGEGGHVVFGPLEVAGGFCSGGGKRGELALYVACVWIVGWTPLY